MKVSVVLAASVLLGGSACAELKPFPLSANQRGTVTCLEHPAVSYDIYLPPGYSANGPALPIIYTFSPSGGGMVANFKTVCSNLNIIVVGIVNYGNKLPLEPALRDYYAVPRDIRQRVLFDPTAVFAGGLSGGGVASYVFSRFWGQHVAGVLPMGGWLNRTGSPPRYYSTDRVQTNLLVARTTGTSDTASQFYLVYDGRFLSDCGAVVQDWSFSGGHTTAPDSVKTLCFQWLLSQRIAAGPTDQSDALAQAADWYARAAGGQTGPVLSECVATLMNRPRTWFALQAQLVVDDLMTNYNSFRALEVANLFSSDAPPIINFESSNIWYWSQNDFAFDLFYFYARGAAAGTDGPRYNGALKALTGIPHVNGDRAGDMKFLLTTYGYPAPRLHLGLNKAAAQLNVTLAKDTPGLDYSLQSRTNLVNDVWQNLAAPVTEYDYTRWSATLGFDSATHSGFLRVATAPSPGTSPPWP